MKLKRLLCLTSLMVMIFLVGCKKESSDFDDLYHDWQFVEIETAEEVVPHTPGLESREPVAAFSDDTITFSFNGKTNYGVVEVAEDYYNITFPDGSRKPMVAKLSDGGNTLTLSFESLNIHIRIKKQ